MNKIKLAIALVLFPSLALAQANVAQWERFEVSYKYQTEQNPFTDIDLDAVFIHEDGETISVNGFYDDDDTFLLRFMPKKIGKWTFTTQSNIPELNGKTGSLVCTTPKSHGMVSAGNDHDFVYGDGVQYHPVGTTSYCWTYGDENLRNQTLKSIEESGFNKVRFCIFPNTSLKDADYEYPFVLLSSKKNLKKELKNDEVNGNGEKGTQDYVWDFNRFNTKFFRHIESCIDRLDEIGVEADVILFDPYDRGRWGFDRMTMDTNLRYLKYIVARLGSFKNVWWSMANEWDYLKHLNVEQWKQMTEFVSKTDPYHHLLSIHGSTATYFDYNLPYITHASIQDHGPLYNHEGAATVRNIFPKPIIFDEVCYEGDHNNRWGQLSGEEMIQRMWTGIIGGTYVTHGESYTKNPEYSKGVYFLSSGGVYRGTAPARIKFMRSILEALPAPPRLADRSWDPMTASCGDGTYLIYFGTEKPKLWAFSLPMKNDRFTRLEGGEKFKVEIIDTWNMTISDCSETFEVVPAKVRRVADKDGKKVKLPGKPYIMIKITKLEN